MFVDSPPRPSIVATSSGDSSTVQGRLLSLRPRKARVCWMPDPEALFRPGADIGNRLHMSTSGHKRTSMQTRMSTCRCGPVGVDGMGERVGTGKTAEHRLKRPQTHEHADVHGHMQVWAGRCGWHGCVT
eukprot:360440-Chlamydomonas_euryale.AAC.2